MDLALLTEKTPPLESHRSVSGGRTAVASVAGILSQATGNAEDEFQNFSVSAVPFSVKFSPPHTPCVSAY
jgi:hypothetical protein